jgi:hypothetical protein
MKDYRWLEVRDPKLIGLVTAIGANTILAVRLDGVKKTVLPPHRHWSEPAFRIDKSQEEQFEIEDSPHRPQRPLKELPVFLRSTPSP